MALNEIGKLPDTAEGRPRIQQAQAPTKLDQLRDFMHKNKILLGILAGMATPVVAGCAQDPNAITAPESTTKLALSLEIIQEAPKGFVGVKVFTELNEPLKDTSFKLIDAQGGTIDSIQRPIQPGDNEFSFVDTRYAQDSEVAVDNGSAIRIIVVSGYDAKDNLVQQEISVPAFLFNE